MRNKRTAGGRHLVLDVRGLHRAGRGEDPADVLGGAPRELDPLLAEPRDLGGRVWPREKGFKLSLVHPYFHTKFD